MSEQGPCEAHGLQGWVLREAGRPWEVKGRPGCVGLWRRPASEAEWGLGVPEMEGHVAKAAHSPTAGGKDGEKLGGVLTQRGSDKTRFRSSYVPGVSGQRQSRGVGGRLGAGRGKGAKDQRASGWIPGSW